MHELTFIDIFLFCLVAIIGLIVLFIPFIRFYTVKKTFQKVNSICVKVNVTEDYSGEIKSTSYQPVLKYSYDSQEYKTPMDTGSSYLNIPVGTQKMIYVNPENQVDIFVPFIRLFVFTTIFGLVFLGVAFLILLR